MPISVSRRVLHRRFLSILARIELHARIVFRHLKCWHTKEDRIAETVSLCWKWFRRLAERGKDARKFASVLATFAARPVYNGRRVCGQLKSKDVLNEVSQRRGDFCVGKLPDFSTLTENPLAEALIDNTRSEVPEQVAFRCDFPRWRSSYDNRRQQVMDDLMQGHRTKDLAEKFRISPARISQLRQEFMSDWRKFVGDE